MLQSNKRRKSRGFLIMEMLFGLVIAGIGIAAAISAYVMISQLWKDDLVMNELSRNANIGIEKMLHGSGGALNTGLLAARDITSPAPNAAAANNVTYTDSANVSRSFYYSGGKIVDLDNNEIVSNVDSVAFSYDGNNVLIALALNKKSGKKEIELSVNTTVSPRN